jgi:hypothetical protein
VPLSSRTASRNIREEQAGDPDGLTHDALERGERVHAGAAPASSAARQSRRCRATDRGARRQAGHGARDAVVRALAYALATPVRGWGDVQED